MLATNSITLKKDATFDEAFSLIPENYDAKVRPLYIKEGDNFKESSSYQISFDGGKTYPSTRKHKMDNTGNIIPMSLDSKAKLKNTKIFYDIFTSPDIVGADATNSWMIGNIDNCNILGDNYNIQGLIISSIFDPTPKYYISFQRLVCENQFSNLGKNSASMYIDMNYFLNTKNQTDENREKLTTLIQTEAEKRIEEANIVYNKLATTHLSDEQINHMFQMLTIDKVAKNNKEKYNEAEKLMARYQAIYNLDDNQNFKGSLFGFVNACTNINTRIRTNPLDVIKPVLPANVIESPCNFEYLCRAAMLNNQNIA